MTIQWLQKTLYFRRLDRLERRLLGFQLDDTKPKSLACVVSSVGGELEMAAKKVLLLCGDYVEDYEVSSLRLLLN